MLLHCVDIADIARDPISRIQEVAHELRQHIDSRQHKKQIIVLTKVDCIVSIERAIKVAQIQEDIIKSGVLGDQQVSVVAISAQARIGLPVLINVVSEALASYAG